VANDHSTEWEAVDDVVIVSGGTAGVDGRRLPDGQMLAKYLTGLSGDPHGDWTKTPRCWNGHSQLAHHGAADRLHPN
jgi:hypothetical protein